MDERDVKSLVNQIRCLILGKKLPDKGRVVSGELLELQEGIDYMAARMQESNRYLRELCIGNLNVQEPDRQNLMCGYLKELHSILKHLTWQTAQVANGDYSQTVNFLGEFSQSFNLMVSQLDEREKCLQAQTEDLSKSIDLVVAVMDGQKDWILVVDTISGTVIYENEMARQRFYDADKDQTSCGKFCALLDKLLKNQLPQRVSLEYYCKRRKITLSVRSFPVNWNGKKACAYYIADITDQKQEQETLQSMAYRDDMTGVFNRRYCLEKLEELLEVKHPFSLVMMDLDGLKYVNDNFGHVCGDEYIKTVVESVRKLLRQDDCICRIGGDEFVLLLPGCSKQSAENRMREIYLEVTSMERPYCMKFSYGVIHTAATVYRKPESLIKKADESMYAMKQIHKRAEVNLDSD